MSPSPYLMGQGSHVLHHSMYVQALEQAGFIVHFVKALHFEHVNAEELASALYSQHGGRWRTIIVICV